MAGARNFREYSVWKEAIDYATFVYEVTGKMPWFEKKVDRFMDLVLESCNFDQKLKASL